jgi:DEAD/DEAH box helicase domain-containing protein
VDLEQLNPLEQFGGNGAGCEEIAHIPFREIALLHREDLGKIRIIAGTPPDLRPLPSSMSPHLKTAIAQAGVAEFYAHQLQAWEELEGGRSIALVTETASGKSNCYIPWAFQRALAAKRTTLLIYPLKALASDQYEKLVFLNDCLPESERLKIGKLTGDVPLEERKAYFRGTRHPDLLLASPDVLHHLLYRVLDGQFELWREFLMRLHLVVIDEAHAYLSSFGIHFANLMRRLRLACRCAGGTGEVGWVLSTATIANPLELASQFTGKEEKELVLIERSGAKRYDRTLLTFKPQASPNYLVANLVQSLSAMGLKGLVFVNSRRTAKSIYSILNGDGTAPNVDVFHGSLPPAKRRHLLDRLAHGNLKSLISTNCLECGIDMASLDYVIVRGINSLNSFWQRGGRCGRSAPGLIIVVPDSENPIDCYYANDPDRFFSPPEKLKINPDYPNILARHLLCAATEVGLHSRTVKDYFGGAGEAIAAELVRQRQVYLGNDGRLTKRGYPHGEVSLRGLMQKGIDLIDSSTGDTLETLPLDFAHKEAHPAAIYISAENGAMQRWRSLSLDVDNSRVELSPLKNTDRITKPKVELNLTRTKILEEPKTVPTKIEGANFRLSLWWGQVSQKVIGYSEIRQLYAPVCTNRYCSRYHEPASNDRLSHCEGCRRKLSKRMIEQVIEEINFPESLDTGYSTPIFKLEINRKLANSIWSEAEGWRERLEREYESEADVPSLLAAVFACNPVQMSLHSLSHTLIKSVPLLFLASDRDVSSLTEQRTLGDQSNAEPFFVSLYDTVHEGCGTTEALYENWHEAISKALELAAGCDCGDFGCPKCLSDHQCPERNEALFKPLGIWLLRQLSEQKI